ncbi:MAG: VanZ family protein [Elusimicrobia bacterium]|nr:VanZ family protein [Candidatus Obscuribacterium magneticum]
MTATKKINWALAIVYVLFIYATLGVIRIPTTFLRTLGLLRFALLALYLSCFATFLIFLIRSGTKNIWRFAALVAMFVVYYFSAIKIKIPEEQVHFLEYGLVGILFLRALTLHIGYNWKSYLAAFLIGSLAGTLDELLQKIVPNRYYDITDVLLNALSVSMGLIICIIYPSGRPLVGDPAMMMRRN